MFIHDYINKLENDFKMLFPDKVPLVVDDGANFIDGKYVPKNNEFVVIVNTGNATIEKIQSIKSFAAAVYLYIYVPFEQRDEYQEKLFDYLVEQSDSDTLYEVGEYTAGFAYNTPSCDGKAKKINGKDYALFLVMGNSNYVEGNFNHDSTFYIEDVLLTNVMDINFNIAPVTETINVIGKKFGSHKILYESQNITLNLLVDYKNTLHNQLIKTVSGFGYSLFRKIKIEANNEEIEFNAIINLSLVKKTKAMNFLTLTIIR